MTATAAVAHTPRVRTVARRGLFWAVLAVLAVAVALLSLLTVGGGTGGQTLDPANAAPGGSRAVVEVLRRHGVTVSTAKSLREAKAAVQDGRDTTVLLYDPHTYLGASRLRQMKNLAAKTVLVDPGFRALDTLAPGVKAAGVASGGTSPQARCAVPAAAKAGSISATGKTYRLTGTGAEPAAPKPIGCFRSAGGAYSFVQTTDATARTSAAHPSPAHPSTVAILGSTDVLRNDAVSRHGNAALALNLLGSTHTLVWYTPSQADVAASGPPSLGALTPGWVTPTLALLFFAAFAAAIWRGRRFGPLVVENLPVVVKAEETMEGRARLYQRSSARLRAVDALRIGAVGRLATRAGLPRTADVTEVAGAVARLTGRDPAAVRGILLEVVPATDVELISLSDRLQDLERALRRVTNGPQDRPRPAESARQSDPSPPARRPPTDQQPTDQGE